MERRDPTFFKDLQQKLLYKFEGQLSEDNYKLFWVDDDGTRIRINDNEDLALAGTQMNRPFYSLIAVIHNSPCGKGTTQKVDKGIN